MTVRVPIRYEAIGHLGDRAIDLSAENIEVDPSGLTHSSATDLQTLAEDVDGLLGASSTPVQSTDPGTLTIATGQFLVQHARLTLTTTERLTIAGTGRLVMADFASAAAVSAAIAAAEAYALALVDDLSGVSDAATARTNLGLGTAATHATTDYDASGAAAAAQAASQPLDSDLTAIAALSTTSFGRAFLALADAAALRTAGGLVIGTDIEAHDTDLTTIAGLSPSNDDIVQRKAGAWTNRTVAQYLSDLGLAALYQPLDSDLTAIAALTTTSTGRSLLAAADAAALRTILALGGSATLSVGTTTGTVAAGDDSRLTDSRTPTTHASTHLPGGSDALATASPGASAPGDAAAAGTNASFARSDHKHSREAYGTTAGTVAQGNDSRFTDSRAPNGTAGGALDGSYPNPGLAGSVAGDGLTETSDVLSVNTDGSTIETSADALRLKDAGTTNAKLANMTQATVKGRASAAGTGAPTDLSATQVRTIIDTNTTPSTQAVGDAAAVGSADTLARGDHKHAMPAFATPAIVLGSAAAAGSAATLVRSDATIAAFDATVPVTQAVGDAAATGAAAVAARRDHVHGMPAYGTTAGTIAQGNDSRLSDARAPLGQPLDPGTFTLATEQFVIQYGHLKLASSERYTMAGTARLVLTDLHAQDSIILGTPKQPTQSFTVPTDWSLDQMFRLSLVNNMRATLQGTADLILTDDFKQRSRLVLS